MFAAILGLGAQVPLASKFYILDGTPEDSPFFGTLAKLAEVLPHSVSVGGIRDAARILTEASAEVADRQGGGAESAPSFVLIHDMPRFRDLRKSDDDFSFSRRGEDKPANPGKLLGTLLRDGPPVGVHVLIWCDSLNNANRAFDRQALREFELRVLFQMSPGDSSNLIDSPLASKLGPSRALFASEEQARMEKFRPYGLPSSEWLAGLRERWATPG